MENGRYLNVEILPNGLKLTLNDEGKNEAVELKEKYGGQDLHPFIDLFEDFLCNGWTLLSAEQLCGLTACQIIISPDASFDDDGKLENVEIIYWHERYQVEHAIEALIAKELFLRKVV